MLYICKTTNERVYNVLLIIMSLINFYLFEFRNNLNVPMGRFTIKIEKKSCLQMDSIGYILRILIVIVEISTFFIHIII